MRKNLSIEKRITMKPISLILLKDLHGVSEDTREGNTNTFPKYVVSYFRILMD
jgi:hypothetical protein